MGAHGRARYPLQLWAREARDRFLWVPVRVSEGRVPSGAWREGPFLSLSWPFQRLVLLSLARGPVPHLQSQQLSTCSLPAWRSRCLPL